MRRISASTELALGRLLAAAASQSDRAACWRAMVWRQLQREGIQVARCTVERLMQAIRLQGVVRGKPKKTMISNKATPCPLDRVNRQVVADRPNAPSRVLLTRAAAQAAHWCTLGLSGAEPRRGVVSDSPNALRDGLGRLPPDAQDETSRTQGAWRSGRTTG